MNAEFTSNSAFNHVEPFRHFCQKVLPLVYDDSLSYYETLCKVVSKLNALIENNEKLPSFIAELISDDKLKEIMRELLGQLQSQIASANEGVSKTATEARTVGEMVWLDGYLFKITHNMIAGDQYVSGSNCQPITIEDTIRGEIENREKFQNYFKNLFVSVLDYGADNTGATDCADAFKQAMSKNEFVHVPKGVYAINSEVDWEKYKCVLYKHPDASVIGLYCDGLSDLVTKDLGIVHRTGKDFERDLNTLFVGRYADYNGGDTVCSAIKGYTKVSQPACTNFEWAIIGQLDNYSNSGENCGGYFQGNKYGDGHTFGCVAEARQGTLKENPTSGLVGLEVDVSADGTDDNYNRVGIDLWCRPHLGTATSQNQWGYGIRLNSQNGLIHKGIHFNGIYAIGIDLSEGTYIHQAIKLGDGKGIDFNSSGYVLKSNASDGIMAGLYYGDNIAIGGTGNLLTLRNPSTMNNRIDVADSRISFYTDGANTVTIANSGIVITGANTVQYTGKVDSSAHSEPGPHLEVKIDGSTYYLPLYN